MKLVAVALDHDGTITTGDRPDESVREAIAAWRASGILVLTSCLRSWRQFGGGMTSPKTGASRRPARPHPRRSSVRTTKWR